VQRDWDERVIRRVCLRIMSERDELFDLWWERTVLLYRKWMQREFVVREWDVQLSAVVNQDESVRWPL
jgi:hypothetical protein